MSARPSLREVEPDDGPWVNTYGKLGMEGAHAERDPVCSPGVGVNGGATRPFLQERMPQCSGGQLGTVGEGIPSALLGFCRILLSVRPKVCLGLLYFGLGYQANPRPQGKNSGPRPEKGQLHSLNRDR